MHYHNLFLAVTITERKNAFPTGNSWFFALRKLIRTAAAYKTTHQKCATICFLFTAHPLVLGLGLGPRSHSERSPNP